MQQQVNDLQESLSRKEKEGESEKSILAEKEKAIAKLKNMIDGLVDEKKEQEAEFKDEAANREAKIKLLEQDLAESRK